VGDQPHQLRRALALVLVLGACSSTRAPVAAPPTSAPAPTTSTSSSTTTTGTVAPTTTSTTVDPGTLPQTAVRPSSGDPLFQARLGLLWQAVVSGDASVALPAFFPEGAYVQVKAIANPGADWHERLVRLYDADIALLHARVAGRSAALVGASVPDGAATWVLPGAEYNKGSYWRVYGTVVHYTVGGVAATFAIQSLISWRGQWYVVHLVTPPR
jgi:hypothetical protein